MKLKKFITIVSLLIIFTTMTGCRSNYQSLNNMAIVSSFLVDKEDDLYKVYIEIYKEEKSDNKSKQMSYYITGKGTNLKDAINDASLKESNTLYFVHLNAIVFSTNTVKNNLNDVFNYLEKRVQNNSEYYILISDDVESLTKSEDKDNPILGEKVKKLIEYSTNNGALIKYDYLEKLQNYVSPNVDVFLNKIETKNKKITINDAYYFNKEKIAGTLNDEEIKLANLFNNNNREIYFTFKYKDEYYVLKIEDTKIKYNLKDGININLKIKATIDSSSYKINLNDTKIINDLNKDAGKKLSNRLNKLITKLKKDHSDILGINNYIYKTKGYKKYDFFKDDTNIKVSVEINRKGLTESNVRRKK